MQAKTALITGITGQDGSYLAEWLLEKGYAVHGLTRGLTADNRQRLAGFHDRIQFHIADLGDPNALNRVVAQLQPDEVYHLAAMSFVPASWEDPIRTVETVALNSLRLLEAVRQHCPSARFFQAGSSEMFGQAAESPQRETTPFQPRSPYGVAKVMGHHFAVNYREAYRLFVCSGILFNHESPRRGLGFVTRKISHSVARIKLGLDRELRLGNLQARRDWGFAGDYVRAMWLMLQQEKPDDYVLGTGETHTVEELVAAAFEHVGLNWRDYVVVDPQFYRPLDIEVVVADPSKARRQLGWWPVVSFADMVRMMVESDLAQAAAQHRRAS